jgi:hypothetical protein
MTEKLTYAVPPNTSGWLSCGRVSVSYSNQGDAPATISIIADGPPLAVGDIVQLKAKPGITYELVFIRDDSAALWGPTYSGLSSAVGAYLKDLERVA